LGVALLIVGPWTLRNQILYGDPLARNAMFTAVAGLIDQKPITSPYFVTLFPDSLSKSLIGVFGWMNVLLPSWIYTLFGIIILVALGGYVWGLVTRKISARLTLVLLTAPLLNLGVVITINLMFTQPQGRYLFAALPAAALIVGLGLDILFRKLTFATPAFVTGLGILNIGVLLMVLIPAYWPPPFPEVSTSTLTLRPVEIRDFTAKTNGEQDELIVAGPDAQMLFETDFNTSEYNFLQIEIEGNASGPNKAVTGGVYFALDDGILAEERLVPFKWTADGQRQLITIPLFPNESWQGRVTFMRIDPVNYGDVRPFVGMPMRIEKIILRGSLK
jgi:hypothetical protein